MERYKITVNSWHGNYLDVVEGNGWKVTDDALLIFKYEDDHAADNNIKTLVKIYNNRYWVSIE